MKKLAVLILPLVIAGTASSQVILTYNDNAMLAGDSVNSKEIQFMPPGNAGPDQIWDFSKIQSIGTNPASHTANMPARHLEGLGNSNVVLIDHGYQYYLSVNENKLEEMGLVSKDYSFVFSDPMLKMKYPFYYGDNFTDKYSGTGSYKEDRKVEISGDYTVIADGYGTLILPERILKNALRLRIEEKGVQVNPCNSIERKIERFLWYIPSARYAVLGFTSSEYTATGQKPIITNTGFINEKMFNSDDLNTVSNDQAADDLAEGSIILFPNPFSKKLSYNYFLRKKMAVSIQLMDMAGRDLINILSDQEQPEGIHSGEIDAIARDLRMGVYYLRFTFGKKVVVSKVVKM
jgi:hypothetical protein